jgi:hypothetical protein
VEGDLADITVEVHLYGDLSKYAETATGYGSADFQIKLADKCTVRDLLARLKIPTAERGITFINGYLSAMPGLQPDLVHILHDGDRAAFFDLKSMWPFQYRSGAVMAEELAEKLAEAKDKGIHHTYNLK